MIFADLLNEKSYELTDDLFGVSNREMKEMLSGMVLDKTWNREGISYLSQVFGENVWISEDKKCIIFPDKLSEEEDANLYYLNVEENDRQSVKIDSDIIWFDVSKDIQIVTYIKGDNRTLYQTNLKEKEKIDVGVQTVHVSENGKKLIYQDMDGTIYRKVQGKEKEKIVGNADRYIVTEDLNTMYFKKDSNLYKVSGEEARIKIASDVGDWFYAYDTGEVYFGKLKPQKEVTSLDFVWDDKKEEDADMVFPDYPSEQDYEYMNFDIWQNLLSEYDRKVEEFYEKERRDQIRAELSSRISQYDVSDLYYYDGTGTVLLAEDVILYKNNGKKPLLFFEVYDNTLKPSLKLSEITDESEISTELPLIWKCAYKGEIIPFENLNAEDVEFSQDGTYVYVNVRHEKENYGDLYQIHIVNNGTVQGPGLYDEEVAIGRTRFVSNDKLIYFKDKEYKESFAYGDLFLNGENIDYDVLADIDETFYDEETDTLLYFTDWDEDDFMGRLQKYVKGEKEEIAYDVSIAGFAMDGSVLYLSDYNLERGSGDLYWCNGKEIKKADEDVFFIISKSKSSEKETIR